MKEKMIESNCISEEELTAVFIKTLIKTSFGSYLRIDKSRFLPKDGWDSLPNETYFRDFYKNGDHKAFTERAMRKTLILFKCSLTDHVKMERDHSWNLTRRLSELLMEKYKVDTSEIVINVSDDLETKELKAEVWLSMLCELLNRLMVGNVLYDISAARRIVKSSFNEIKDNTI